MTELILLLSLWPFHHHKKPNDVFVYHAEDYDRSCECVELYEPHFTECDSRCTWIADRKTDADWEAYFEAQRQKISDADCTKQDGLYYYVAEDGAIAFSHAGCDAAKSNSKIARTLNRVEMSKI